MAVKIYKTVAGHSKINFFVKFGRTLSVDGLYSTEDESIQEIIESSKSFERGFIKLVEPQGMREAAEDVSTRMGAGKSYGLHELAKMTVPQLRKLCSQRGTDSKGKKKKELIQALLGG